MATRIDTIPIFMGGNGSAGSGNGPFASGAACTFGAVAATIEQMGVASGSGGGVIRKAYLEVRAGSNNATVTTGWSFTLAVNGGAASPAYAKTGQAIGGTGGYYPIYADGDFTAWLAANWPAATASCSIVGAVTFTGPAVINVSAILWVDIEYDEAACPTITKWLPLMVGTYDGQINASTYTQIATVGQYLGLGSGFRIAENGASIVQAKFELSGDSGGLMNAGSLGTPQIRVGGAGGTAYTFASETVGAGGLSRWCRFLVDAPSPTASTTVEMKTTDGNASYPYLFSGQGVIAHYVYSYTQVGTTHVTVGARIFASKAQGMVGYASSANAAEWRVRPHVPESAVTAQGPMGWVARVGDSDHLAWNAQGDQLAGPAYNASVIASQTAQRYERVRHNDGGCNDDFYHRVDGTQTLVPGWNYFRLKAHASDTSTFAGGETARRGVQPSVAFWWSYVAPVPAAGPTAVTRNVRFSIMPKSYFSSPSGEARFNYSSRHSAAERATVPIPSSAFIQGFGFEIECDQNTTAISLIAVARQGSKPFVTLTEGHVYGGFSTCVEHAMVNATDSALQYPAQPVPASGGWVAATDMEIQAVCGNGGRMAIVQELCIHDQMRTVTVTVSNQPGSSTGVAVSVFDAVTRVLVAEGTTTAGVFSFTYPDSVNALFASASQSGQGAVSSGTTSSSIGVAFPTPAPPPSSAFNGGYN